MMFAEQFEILRTKLNFEKQQQILKKAKKPFGEDVSRYRVDENGRPIEESYENDGEFDKRIKVVNVNIGKDGGILTYFLGGKEPMRGYADGPTVALVSGYKRLFMLILSNLSKVGWFGKICTLLAIKYNFNIVGEYFQKLFELNLSLLHDQYYTQSVREIRRVLKDRVSEGVRDAIGMVLEYDTAYRFRFQDVIVELDKTKDTRKEVCRLLQLLADREREGFEMVADKWLAIKKFANVALLIPSIKRQVKIILEDLNLDEVRMSKEDLYWTNEFNTFNYRGKLINERRAENKKIYG